MSRKSRTYLQNRFLCFLLAVCAQNADAASVVRFTRNQYLATEGSRISIDIVLSEPLKQAVTIDCQVIGGSATPGRDYEQPAKAWIFAAGETRKTIAFEIFKDDIPEVDEQIALGFESPSTDLVFEHATRRTEVIISDANAVVAFERNEVQINETSGVAVIPVRRFGDRVPGFKVEFETESMGVAQATRDYAPVSGTLQFASGQITQNIEIPIIDNPRVDGVRQFQVRLKNVTATAQLPDERTMVVVIADNELPAGMLDHSFVPPANVQGLIALLPDGKMLVRGAQRILRLHSDGLIDLTFNDGFGAIHDTQGATHTHDWDWPPEIPVAIQTDGKIIVYSQDHVARLNPDGSLDRNWKLARTEGNAGSGHVTALALQADGKVLLVGRFARVNRISRPYLARLNSDGSLENEFPAGSGIGGANQFFPVLAVATQNDGKILIGGSFAAVDGVTRPSLARLNTDGTLDPTFVPRGPLKNLISAITLGPDGKIYAAGGAYDSQAHVARLNSDGSPDETFASSIDSGGAVPSGDSSIITALTLQPDGKVLIGGYFASVDGVPRNAVMRLLPNGRRDRDFDPGLVHNTPELTSETFGLNNTTRIAVQSDGRILIGGAFTFINGTPIQGIARLLPTSRTNVVEFTAERAVFFENQENAGLTVIRRGDSASELFADYAFTVQSAQPGRDYEPTPARIRFGPLEVQKTIPIKIVPDSIIEPDEDFQMRLTQVGVPAELGFYDRITVTIADANGRPGSLDPTFDAGFFPTNDGYPWWAAVQVLSLLGDGRIYIAGHFSRVHGHDRTGIARLLPDGSVDATFVPAVQIDGHQIVVQSDGRILSGWGFWTRLHPDGSLDPSFRQNISSISGRDVLVIQPDGKIVGTGPVGLTRFNSDGSIDETFKPPRLIDGVEVASLQVIGQPDGKLVVAGNRVARLNVDGSLDPLFTMARIQSSPGEALIACAGLQADGKIVVMGRFASVNGVSRRDVARLNTNGSLDESFSVGTGLLTREQSVRDGLRGGSDRFATAFDHDRRIILGGPFVAVNGVPRKGIARLHEDGSVDESFDPGGGVQGRSEDVWAIAVQSDGQILIVGNFTIFNGVPRWGIARLNGDRNIVRLRLTTTSARTLQIEFRSQPGRMYEIQSSQDLTNWSSEGSLQAQGAATQFSIRALPNGSHRYYRAVLKP